MREVHTTDVATFDRSFREGVSILVSLEAHDEML